MADVFISYKQRMRPRVAQIAQALEALGLSVWFDIELAAGQSFAAVINAELAKAGCVIVCWTPDAFAPDDGSDVSWVEAEASVARERKAIVPIMLERTPLKAPWNMFHTERLLDWSGSMNDPAWLNVLEAIGRHVDRPGLAELAAAQGDAAALAAWAVKYPGDPHAARAAGGASRTLARRHLPRFGAIPRAARWLLGAGAISAIGSIILNLRMGPQGVEGPASFVFDFAPVVSSMVFALALWRGGSLDFGRSLFSVFAGALGWVGALFTLPLIVPFAMVLGLGPEIAVGASQAFLAGTVGALISSAGVALLMGNVGGRGWTIVTGGSLLLGIVCGIVGGGLFYRIYPSNFFWIVWVWSVGYGVLLAMLAASRPARII